MDGFDFLDNTGDASVPLWGPGTPGLPIYGPGFFPGGFGIPSDNPTPFSDPGYYPQEHTGASANPTPDPGVYGMNFLRPAEFGKQNAEADAQDAARAAKFKRDIEEAARADELRNRQEAEAALAQQALLNKQFRYMRG